ncbi:MAG: uracil-DNA glycosylase [Caldithrix sp.]|nr:uracil-DNA glycosylase [Caldithrix sp.]
MEDIYKQLKAFLQWYSEVYEPDIHLNGQLVGNKEIQDDKRETVRKPVQNGTQAKPDTENWTPALTEFYESIKDCQKCGLGATRTNFVFGSGNANAKLMFIGEAPGRDEDLQGKPFVGKAGKLLDKMLKAIGRQRADVFIANMLKCRPPQNRDPQTQELAECEPYLLKQLDLIQPKLIVALGRVAGQSLLKESTSLSKMRGQIHTFRQIPLIVTYHPAALLRSPRYKQQAWQDWKTISSELKRL